MANKTWIVYKADSMNAPGWEERRLEPSAAGTDLLWENWDFSGHCPQLGDRTRIYANLLDDKGGITHSRADDWVVARIQTFTDAASDEQIIVCYCSYSPIEVEWQQIPRGKPVHELMAEQLVG